LTSWRPGNEHKWFEIHNPYNPINNIYKWRYSIYKWRYSIYNWRYSIYIYTGISPVIYIHIYIYVSLCIHGDIPFIHIFLVGGFNPSEKYESQLGLLFPISGKIQKCFPNHQPDL